jgi:flagellar biosynthetic protein FlhB
MAEGSESDDKTEEPSAKKLREARENGQVAQSREINTWVILFTAMILLSWVGMHVGETLSLNLKQFIARPESFVMDKAGIANILVNMTKDFLSTMGPPLFIFFIGAGAASFIQIGPMFSAHSMVPNLDKINPMKGAARVFGSRAWIEFIKALVKMILVSAVGTIILIPIFSKAPALIGIDTSAMLEDLQNETHRLLIGVLSILAVFAGLDYGVQRFQLMKQLRMSKQELKDEYKQSEGDPHIKARLRELRMKRARKRMMANVPRASVIITNPTHYAIALEYNQEKSSAPIVTAKGVDRIALRIREVAKENDVPIVENRPLARAMYDNAELDEEIPEEHYKAVAQIISYVYSLKRR